MVCKAKHLLNCPKAIRNTVISHTLVFSFIAMSMGAQEVRQHTSVCCLKCEQTIKQSRYKFYLLLFENHLLKITAPRCFRLLQSLLKNVFYLCDPFSRSALKTLGWEPQNSNMWTKTLLVMIFSCCDTVINTE